MKRKLLSWFLVIFIVFIVFILGAFYFIVEHQSVDLSALEYYNPGRPSILLDDNGNEWARFELDRREQIAINCMPKHLIHAFIAAEDWNFFSHSGISLKGIVRSTLVNLYRGKKVQGASTITQQLVKLLFFNNQKTFKRKIKEQLFAILVERKFTKEQILQTYLNHVYFGYGIYGVEAASQRFWQKSVKDLSLDEAATLAAVIKSPGNYYPPLCPLSAQNRRNIILQAMKKLGFISDADCAKALAQPIKTLLQKLDFLAPHAKETIRQFVEQIVGRHALYCSGLVIQTTINQHIQRQAQKAFENHIANLRKTFAQVDGALISIDSKTGEIKALIGGADFNQSQFNRALNARRQIGSIFKPLVYAAAIEYGMHFTDTDLDEPIIIEQENGSKWEPQNNTREFEGIMTLARALSISNNIVTIKTLLKTGIDPVIKLAQKCRLSGPFHRYPSLALGCVDSTLKEATGAFNIFANNGIFVDPHLIKWIKNEWGIKIWRITPIKERVLSSQICSQVSRVLSIGMSRFRRRLNSNAFDVESIGKTGTTNDCRTSWFCGSTPELTTGIYIGHDDNRSMGKNVYGVTTAFPIWFKFYQSLKFFQKKFNYDPSLQEIFVDLYTGLPSTNTQNPRVFPLLV